MTQFGEYVKMALKNIWANKIRTLLTMLGIIIGISSVILIISIGNGATELITSELGEIGQGQINFYVNDSSDKYLITDEQLEDIRQMDGVKAVAVQNFFDGVTTTKRDDFNVSVVTINPDGFAILDEEFVSGAPYTEAEAQGGKPYAVISEEDAMLLFGSTNVVGMDLSFRMWDRDDINVIICGVTKSEDDNMIENMAATPMVQVLIPQEVITNQTGLDFSDSIYDFYVLKEDDADAKVLCENIIEYLETKNHCKGKDVYLYQSFDDIMATVNSVIKLITVFVSFVASVSLLVGGIGVMNIMLVSVTERTREIGIRKALGAKTGSITIQFLAESAFITLLGGIIGILMGIGGAWIIAGVIGMMVPEMHFAPALGIGTILLASAFSTVVGLIFGVYPARKAAKLSPIEALRQN
ncbi:MAG: ABC transporter permease [Lachnospiraceae bacterium]